MPYRPTATATNKDQTTATDLSHSTLNTRSKAQGDGQGVTGAEPIPARKPPFTFSTLNMKSLSSHDATHNANSKLSLSSRRRQSAGPNAKSLQGPRPLDLQNRSVSGSMRQPYTTYRGASSVAVSEQVQEDFHDADIPQFDFGSIDPTRTVPQTTIRSSDFAHHDVFSEPNFDFDAFHDNIIAASPRLDKFSSPAEFEIPDVPAVPKFEQSKVPRQPAIPVPTRKTPGVSTLVRTASTASGASRIAITKPDTVSGPSTMTSILRGRRQTQFPPNAFNNMPPATKAPRKSVGPGTFVAPDMSQGTETSRRPSVNGRKQSIDGTRSGLPTNILGRTGTVAQDGSKSPHPIKVKTTLLPGKRSSKDLLTPSKTPDGSHVAPVNPPTTPNRRSGTPGRTTTPGAHSRRQSVATGLGARTISPTDARRLKRMSMVPPAPPLPQSRISQAPPTPQPDLIVPPPRPRSTAQSPAATNRKSMTPSSSRTTPDPNRKSYSSGQSLSSNTSYSSTRNSASLNARLARDVSSSRLPTPKPRVETDTTPEGTEEIPPVPAIPKSYESPASEIDLPFFSARSSGMQVETPVSDGPNVTTAAEAFAKLNLPHDSFSSSLMSQMSDGEQRPINTRKSSEKSESSLRLPPLNLLPLSTPTTERIRLFRSTLAARPVTPPEARAQVKTPSTPMTASKASSFFPVFGRGRDDVTAGPPRSSTSHFVIRSEEKGLNSASPHLPVFAFEADNVSLRSISPFLSTSAPKDGNEFPNYMRPNFNSELRRVGTQGRPNGPRAPSHSLVSKPMEGTPVSDRQTDSSAAASTGSIQITSNLQKSNITPSESIQSLEETSKTTSMPPPRLPASATWNSLSGKSSSPTQQKSGFFRSRRKASTSSNSTFPELERQSSVDSSLSKPQISGGRPSLDSMKSLMLQSNRSGSLLGAPGATNSKATSSRAQEGELDRDDMVAEEEMKKLASRRRDFESAARQLDGLRARARPSVRTSPSTALQHVSLNIFERGEVVDFPDVFFTGTKKAKKIVGDLASSINNFGYDDDRGDYNIVDGDHLAYRYEVIDLLGKGSFGQVVRCIDHKTGTLVAVKIIRNKKRFHQQALIEVDILQKLKEWDPHKKYNVVNFDQSFYFRGHLCISTDLLNMNLYEFIKAHDFRGFSLKLIRRFTKQMLGCLVLLHGKKVIHCDLKPENILLAHPAHSEIKVIDFGSSCFENEKVYTYIQSRFYRSPEVILGMSYGMPIDMWSVGCILAELFTGYPIFPGENEQEQLACIMEIFGPPEKHLIEKSSRKKLFFDSMGKPRLTVSSKGRRRRPSSKDLRQVLKCEDEAFLDFITRCLRWDPARRITPQEANRHEFITGIKPSPAVSARKHITSALSTPLRRGNSVSTAIRPLPQPPMSNLKPTLTVRQDSLAPSPVKPAARRQSTMTGFQAANTTKRASNAVTSVVTGASLGRINTIQRNINTRTDLATAAAAASLAK